MSADTFGSASACKPAEHPPPRLRSAMRTPTGGRSPLIIVLQTPQRGWIAAHHCVASSYAPTHSALHRLAGPRSPPMTPLQCDANTRGGWAAAHHRPAEAQSARLPPTIVLPRPKGGAGGEAARARRAIAQRRLCPGTKTGDRPRFLSAHGLQSQTGTAAAWGVQAVPTRSFLPSFPGSSARAWHRPRASATFSKIAKQACFGFRRPGSKADGSQAERAWEAYDAVLLQTTRPRA